MRKSTQHMIEEKPNNEANLDYAIEAIITKQTQRKQDELRFQEAK